MKSILRLLTLFVCLVSFSTSSLFAETIRVPQGGNLQYALDIARCGDEIRLPAGSLFVGHFVLPDDKGCTDTTRIIIRGEPDLPLRRVTKADAPLLPVIVGEYGYMALDGYGSSNWTVLGIQFLGNPGGEGEVIGLWGSSNITFDRILMALKDGEQLKRGILGNGSNITLVRSHLSGIWKFGQDSQAFAAWDGPGPYKIIDNFLEAAGENVLIGGADSSSEANIPADILVEGNHFFKRREWIGTPRNVKNLFELKSAKRSIIRGNVFENNWTDGQSGTAIVITPRNQDKTAPWTVIDDVLFTQNIVIGSPHIFNVLGYDDLGISRQTTNIKITHNLLKTVDGSLGIFTNEVGPMTFDHNTYINDSIWDAKMLGLYDGGVILIPGGSRRATYAVQTLNMRDNFLQFNGWGLHSSNFPAGTQTLYGMTRGYDWRNNVLVGGYGDYPTTTLFLEARDRDAQFDAQYRLVTGSAFAGAATDGTDIGWHGQTGIVTPPPPPPVDPEPQPTNQAPVPEFSVSVKGLTVQFTDATTDDQGIAYRHWHFADGTADENVLTPVHTYAAAGTYNVRLMVTDSGGISASIWKTVTVTEPVVVDTTAPEITAKIVRSGKTANYNVRATATDASGITLLTCQVNGKFTDFWFTAVAGVPNVVVVTAKDAAGNIKTVTLNLN